MAQDFFSVHELENTVFDVMEFKGKWLESLGKPEKGGSWFIWGESYQGKTNFTIQLAKYLTQFTKHKVLINSLEEGKSQSLKLTSKRSNLSSVKEKILFGNRVPMERVKERLRKQRSPEIIVTDSLQEAEMDKKQYRKLKEEFPDKLFIWISQADGKIERGSLAKHIRNDANIKIRVEGFTAHVESRYGGGEPYVIDAVRAAKFHGKIKENNSNNENNLRNSENDT